MVFVPNAQGLRGGARAQNAITTAFERPGCDRAHGRFILDQQQGFAAPTSGDRLARRTGPNRSAECRQENAKRASVSEVGIDFDPAVMVLHDSEDRREPEARPFANLLGREKWLEDTWQNFRRDSAAGVIHAQPNETPNSR